jgi:radical SAM superfamily enzyme YgiQ (UPF0313 family)
VNVFFIKPGGATGSNFPHATAALGAYLKVHGHKTAFFDASLGVMSPEQVLKAVDFSSADVLASTLLTGWQAWFREFALLFKDAYPGKPIVVGGPHVSALKALAVEHACADYGVVGEGEVTFLSLLQSISNGSGFESIGNIVYRKDQTYLSTPLKYERVPVLDELPIPDYTLARPDAYFHTYLGASVPRKRYRSVQTVTSRGCPFKCTFCATNCTWNSKITFASPERVIAELKHLKNDHGVEEFWLGDDGFTASRSRAIKTCELMIDEKLEMPWRIPNGIRLETVTDELAAVMKRSGCYMVGIGIETGSNTMMKKIKKRTQLDLVEDKVRLLHKHGIATSGFFIIGFPDETESEIRETIQFMMSSPLKRMQISIFAPYPGSEDFSNIFREKEDGYDDRIRRYLYEGYMPEFLSHTTVDVVQKYFRNLYLKFYMRPHVLFDVMRSMTFTQVRDIFAHPGFRRMWLWKRDARRTYVDFQNV